MKKILLIEDDLKLLEKKIIELDAIFPYPIVSVQNYEDLQKSLEEHKKNIFIALLDNVLMGAKEYEAVDLLLANNIPTIVYTEEFSNEAREILFDKGVLDYIIKKPTSDALYTTRLIERVYKNSFIKALIVDGSQNFRNKLALNLQQFGLKCLQSADAQTTVKILETNTDIQLVMIDSDISGDIQGIELVENIREQFPSTALGILGMSPHGYNSQLSIEYLKKGANDFIIKPFVKEQLNLRIMQVLEMLDIIKEKHIQATVDPLTQLKNRRALEVEVKGMISKVMKSNAPLSVAMIDIDFFKSVNDTYGHDIGDGVLQFVSQQLKSSFRRDDLLVRNGGEEFCVVLEDLSQDKAIAMFESLRKKIELTPYVNNDVKIEITISIGLFYGIKDDINTMLSIADERLYVAKESGRNMVVFK